MSYVVQNRGRWFVVTYQGLDPATGRESRQWRAAANEAAAREFAASEPTVAGRPHGRQGSGITVARFLPTRWLPTKEPTLRATTFHRYRRSVEAYVLPRIGRVPIRRLTARHLEELYAQLLVGGRVDGTGGLAPKTVLNLHQILRKALTDAVRKGLVARNVALAVDPRRVSSHKSSSDHGRRSSCATSWRHRKAIACFR